MEKQSYNPQEFAASLPSSGWTKSSFSAADPQNCVQWQTLPDGGFALGDSMFPNHGALRFSADERAAFIRAVKAGELD